MSPEPPSRVLVAVELFEVHGSAAMFVCLGVRLRVHSHGFEGRSSAACFVAHEGL